jgi:hypothetical protein
VQDRDFDKDAAAAEMISGDRRSTPTIPCCARGIDIFASIRLTIFMAAFSLGRGTGFQQVTGTVVVKVKPALPLRKIAAQQPDSR